MTFRGISIQFGTVLACVINLQLFVTLTETPGDVNKMKLETSN